ncbi:MAG: hypothetical protein PHW73_01325 [Atribacterota bacterium]|nr:hypothetical protein [Atribacterota bacterium]
MSDVADTTIVILAEMRSFLNVPNGQTGKDDLLIDLLDSYNSEIEEYLGVTLINSTYTETYDGNGKDYLFLDHYPIASVTSLIIDDVELTEDTDFYVHGDEGYIKLDGSTFTVDLNNVDIVYVAGHGAARANISNVLKNALKTWVSRVWKAENIDFSTQFDNSNMGYLRSQMMPWDIKQKLDYFKCRSWGKD